MHDSPQWPCDLSTEYVLMTPFPLHALQHGGLSLPASSSGSAAKSFGTSTLSHLNTAGGRVFADSRSLQPGGTAPLRHHVHLASLSQVD